MGGAKEPIKLGRINKACEKALGLSLTSEVAVYMEEDDLNRLAIARPHDYLKTLEEIGAIIKRPDYVRFEKDKEEITYLKEYLQEGAFVKVAVCLSHCGTPKRWRFVKMYRLQDERARQLNSVSLFVRVEN